MKALIPLAASLAALGGASTDYTAPRTLRVLAETSLELETTAFTMERDGEPVEAGFGGGSSLEERTVEQTFRVLAHEDGAPTKVQRAFETVERKTTSEMRGESTEHEEEGPLQGVTLELTLDGGEVEVEVVGGTAPKAESALKGHSLTLSFDALLAAGDAGGDEAFDLPAEAILTALALDLEDALFPRPETPEGGEGRRGFSGPRPSALRNLARAEWKGTATPRGEVEHEGVPCLELGLKLEAEGELEPFSFGGGSRRGRMPEAGGATAAENTITAKLEGRLLFAKEGRYPVLFEVEGSVSTVRDNDFERDGSTTHTHSEQEGTLTLRTRLSAEAAKEE
jgi:hypothetical protein